MPRDIVFAGEDVCPCIVIRSGYGQYEQEVRVAGTREDLSDWRTGRWVRSDRVCKLEAGEDVRAICDIRDSYEQYFIPEGTRCKFVGRDEDDDIILVVGGKRLVVFAEDVDKLTLQ